VSTAAITVSDLSFRYADSERWALRNVSLTIGTGDTTLILGPSGCGKSTLALCLNGLIPTVIEGDMTGEVAWPTTESSRTAPDTRYPIPDTPRPFIGQVFQDPETQVVMPRVDEEVAFGLENMGVPAAEMPARIADALELVGLDDRPRAWVDDLSGGQKQRLALASVLALQPAVIVLDEPSANLDPAATVVFYETLARLKAELGMTIVLIEHRLDAVMPLVDSIVAMNRQGEVIAQGAPHEIFAAHGDELEREGVWLPMTCRLMTALHARGWPVDNCPLTMDEVEASLRRVGRATSTGVTAPRSPQSWGVGGETQGTDGADARSPQSWGADGETQGTDGADARSPQSWGVGGRSTAAIALHNVSFAYPESSPALRDVSLEIAQGRFFAIVGANGSGKTTLAKQLVGLLRPTSGTIAVLGQDTRQRSAGEIAREVGYVFQNPEHQFVTERVADELAYSLRGRWPQDEIERRVKDLLAVFGLEGREDENPFALSQGQKRRLSVATMAALDQPILILDEPTFGQDQQSTTALMSTLQKLHANGTTIIFITHDMQLVAEYADEALVMDAGRMIFQGAPRDLFQQPGVLQQASLVLPPLAELARRLDLPPMLTIEEWSAWAAGARLA
jgi:energy-coupling factor transport system ATP-binding protein